MEQLSQLQNNAKREVLAATEKLRAEAVCVSVIAISCYFSADTIPVVRRRDIRCVLRSWKRKSRIVTKTF